VLLDWGAATPPSLPRSRAPIVPVRRLLLSSFLLCASGPLAAQDVFVAPSVSSILAFTEDGIGENPAHVLYVVNNSTVPIVVFGVILSQCENVKQPCGSRPTKIRIAPRRRATVGRVQPRDTERAWEYRWTFSYHADSTDAAAIAALRAHGIDLDPRGGMRRTEPAAAPEPAAPAVAQAQAAEPIDTAPPHVLYLNGPPKPEPERPADRPTTLRVKLGWGSIIGSTMVPGQPVLKTGPCLNPAETAKVEKDASIARAPWRPATLSPSTRSMRLPEELRDSVQLPLDVLVRFAVDSAGVVIPESVSVLESSSGALSVAVCKSLFSLTVYPARDKSGRAVGAWVQYAMPMRLY
jgi:hypothetical protein